MYVVRSENHEAAVYNSQNQVEDTWIRVYSSSPVSPNVILAHFHV